MALSAHLNWLHPPNQHQSRPPKRAARDQLRLHNPKASHPRRQDGQMNYLDILAIFVKQRTYLATLPSFGHLALSLHTPQKFEKDET